MSLHDNRLFEPRLLHLWNGVIVLLAGYVAKIQEEVVFVGLLFFLLHLQDLSFNCHFVFKFIFKISLLFSFVFYLFIHSRNIY